MSSRCSGNADSESPSEAHVMSRACFGVEPRKDGSVLVASQEGEAASIRHFPREQAATVVEFVRKRSHSPRVCVASTGGHALRLALAFGELPEAEVILLRPAVLPHRVDVANSEEETEVALALARYARRAA